MHFHTYRKTMHAIENVRSECSKFILIFTWLWGNVILWSQGSRWSVGVLQRIKQLFRLERLGDTGLRDALEGLDKDLWRRNKKCPVFYTSLLSLPLQQPKLNPAGADRAQLSLSLTINFCCFCFQLWHFLAPAGTQCRKLTLLRNQKRNQC